MSDGDGDEGRNWVVDDHGRSVFHWYAQFQPSQAEQPSELLVVPWFPLVDLRSKHEKVLKIALAVPLFYVPQTLFVFQLMKLMKPRVASLQREYVGYM